MSGESIWVDELEQFYADGWIGSVLHTVKGGKEATVYCCTSGPKIDAQLVAAKVYRPRMYRDFKNDSVYQEGRVILHSRLRRAVRKKTKAGRGCQFGMWVEAEFETLSALHKAGADVPRPYTRSPNTVLMEYVGDSEMAAPPLRYVRIDPGEARGLFECLMRNVELWLSCNCVHGDLSPFNILYWNGDVKVIDFPQAVDPRFNRNARDLLTRDVENVCAYFRQYGMEPDAQQIVWDLWTRFRYAVL